MTTTRYRSAAALTVAGLAAATLPLMTAGTADAATTIAKKGYDYSCVATPEGTALNVPTIVGVTPTFTIPSLYKGQKVGPTKVGLAIKLDETLRRFTYDSLKGRTVVGSSTDASLALTANDQTISVPIPKLSAPKTTVPSKVNAAWIIPASGTAPIITVPDTSSVKLSMPKNFTITSTVYKDNDKTGTNVNFVCALPASTDGTITTQAVRNKTTLSASTSPSTIKAKSTTPYVTVTAKSATTPTGAVTVYNGSKKVGSGKLSKGKVKVKLAKFTKKGKATLKIAYAGDKSAVDTSITKAVTVK